MRRISHSTLTHAVIYEIVSLMVMERTTPWRIFVLGVLMGSIAGGAAFVTEGAVRPSPVESIKPTLDNSSQPEPRRASSDTNSETALKVEETSTNTWRIGSVELDKKTRTITVPARVKVRNQLVEYALVHETGKAYEAMLVTTSSPLQINLAFVLLGLTPLEIPLQPGNAIPRIATHSLTIHASWETNGVKITKPLGELITLAKDATDTDSIGFMAPRSWQYNGSIFEGGIFAAQRDGSIISLIRDATALVNNIGEDIDNDQVHIAKEKILPPENFLVQITFQLGLPR